MLCLILVGITGGYLWLSSGHARHLLQARVNAAIPGALSWEALHLSVFTGRIEAKNLRLNDPTGETLISLDRLVITLRWTDLFRKTLTAETVILEKPQIWLDTDPTGELNLLKALPTPTPSEPQPNDGTAAFPFNIRIHALSLTDGFFHYEQQDDRGEKKQITVHHIGLNLADGNLFKQSAQVSLLLQKGEIDTRALVTDFKALRFDGRLEKNQITSGTLQLDSDLLHLAVTGGVSDLFTVPLFDVQATASTDLSQIREAFHLSPTFTGPVMLHLKARGRVTNPTLTLSLECPGGELAGIRVDQMTFTGSLKEKQLILEKMEIESALGQVAATGKIDLQKAFPDGLTAPTRDLKAITYHLAVTQAGTALENLPGNSEGITGDVHASLSLQGVGLSPETMRAEARLELTARNLAAKKIRIGDLNTRLRLHQGLLTVDEARLQNGASELRLSGNARVLEATSGAIMTSPDLNFTLSGKALSLRDFFEGREGRVDVKGHLTGSVAHPQGTLSVNAQNIDLGIQKIQALTLDSQFDKNRVTVESLSLTLGEGETLTADGWYSPAKKHYGLHLNTPGISLKHIDSIQADMAAEGKINANITGTGSLENPQLAGEFQGTHLRLNNKPFDDGSLKLTLQDHLVRAKGTLGAEFTGFYALKTHLFSGKALLDQTPLRPFFESMGRKDLTGTVTGFIEVEGNADTPETLQAVTRVSQLSLSHNDIPLVSAGVCDASIENGTLHVPTLRLDLFHQGHLEITGKARHDGAIDFQADGALPLEVIHLFTEALSDITGEIQLAARLKGTRKQPDFQADLRLKQLKLTVPVLNQKLHSVNGQLHLTPETLTIKKLTGNLDKGRLDLSGTLALDQFTPVSITARLNAYTLPIRLPETLEVLLNGGLTFSGTPERSIIAGNIVLLEGLYYKEIKLGLIDSLGEKKRAIPPVTQTESPLLLKNTDLHITLHHRAPLIVDNNIVLMALKPTLTLHGPLSGPLVSGRAEVESGVISYLGKEFEIKKGVLDFINPYKIEATIDLESEIKVRTWTLHLRVSGVEDNLKFDMSSTPSETDATILSLLLFNKTREEMIDGEGGSHQSTRQMVADLVARTLQGSLKEATGLDTLEMKYTERTDPEEADDVNITVGKELSKRMTLKYGIGTKNGVTVQSAITEYKFYENVLMNAFRDTDGDFGGELMFRLEMR